MSVAVISLFVFKIPHVGITETALNRVDTEKFKPTGTWLLDSVCSPNKSITMIQNGLLNKAQ